VYIYNTTIRNNNASTDDGGGLFLGPGSNATLERCRVTNNRAVYGGAIAVKDGGCLWVAPPPGGATAGAGHDTGRRGRPLHARRGTPPPAA
jgi:parallel beta-helix repeat protein